MRVHEVVRSIKVRDRDGDRETERETEVGVETDKKVNKKNKDRKQTERVIYTYKYCPNLGIH